MKKLNSIFLIVLICFQLIAPFNVQSQSFNPSNNKKLIHYNIRNWGTESGLPTKTLISLYLSKSGYLWISSYKGLIRFNGLEFKLFNKMNYDELPSNSIRSITGDESNNIWLGTGSGLALYKDGIFKNYAAKGYVFDVNTIYVDQEKEQVWIGTREKGVYIFDINSETYNEITFPLTKNTIIRSIKKSKNSGIWIGTEGNGLINFQNNSWSHYSNEQGLTNNEILNIYVDNNDLFFIATTDGLYYFDGVSFKEEPELKNKHINKVVKDNIGNLWVLTPFGMYRKSHINNMWEFLSKNEGLTGNYVNDILFGNEGNIWVATYRRGLDQLINSDFITFSTHDGLTSNQINIIKEAPDNKLFLGSITGDINVFNKGKISPFSMKTQQLGKIYDIFFSKDQSIWIATYNGLIIKQQNGKENVYSKKNGLPTNQIRVIHEDREENIWIGTRSAGLLKTSYKKNSNAFDFEEYNISNGSLNSNFIMSIDEDQNGDLLIGTNTGGLNIITKNEPTKFYTTNDGLVSNVVFNSYADENNIVWLTLNGGISRFEKGVFFNYTINDGLPDDSPFDILEDLDGYFWITSGAGIIKVKKQELNDYKNNIIKKIHWKTYDNKEGLRKSECFGASRSEKTQNGELWFPTIGGPVKVDPSSINSNLNIPIVSIKQLIIDDKKVNLDNQIIVYPDKHRYVFSFTALNFKYPEKVRFKYKIENFDNDWVDAGNKKQAIYTGLPHRKLIFKVLARNNDGKWSTTPAVLQFEILPFFYQTWWFYSFVIVAFILICFVYAQWRTHYLKRKYALLEKKVQQRTSLLKQRSDENEILNSISSNLIAPIDLNALLNKIVESAVNIVPSAEKGSILLLDKEENILIAKAVYGHPEDYLENLKIEIGEGQTGKAVKENRSFIENNIKETNPSFFDKVNKWYPVKSIIVVLLKVREEIIGTIAVDNISKNEAFNSHDMELLKALAANASVAIERVSIYQELKDNKTSLEKSYKKLKELDEFKEAMTGMIVHDFKNSLNTVINFAQGIPSKNRLKSIKQAGYHMLNMVLNILDVQKFEKANIMLSLSNESLNKVIKDAVEQVSFLIEKKFINVTFSLENKRLVRIDYELLTRVVVNILTNAIKYTPPNGSIYIRSENKEKFTKISISDTGIGIPSDRLESIFNKYEQIDPVNEGGVRSTGIGLTFCKMAIEAQGGEIGVKSEEGAGAYFWFTIPIVNKQLENVLINKELTSNKFSSKEIKFTEDDKIIMLPLIQQLKKWDVYSFSEVNHILAQIEDNNSLSIVKWHEKMKETMKNLNQEKFEELIRI